MVPRTIWQTYRDAAFNPEMQKYADSWKNLNTNYKYGFLSDIDIDVFIKEYFDDATLKMFREFPIGVMRADFWRYAVLYVHGGVYADIDAECLVPIDHWLNEESKIVIGLENDHHFCQWCIAATANHPVLETVIELICERWEQKKYFGENYVHHYSGPGVWTAAVLKSLNLESLGVTDVYEKHQNAEMVFLDDNAFLSKYVKHHFGSQKWLGDNSFQSWTQERKEFIKLAGKVPSFINGWELNSTWKLQNDSKSEVFYQFECNDSAMLILSLCDGERSIFQIVNLIEQLIPEVPSNLLDEVRLTLEKFVYYRVIELSS
jgi:mannosyltransferase OCH1-like enzyme